MVPQEKHHFTFLCHRKKDEMNIFIFDGPVFKTDTYRSSQEQSHLRLPFQRREILRWRHTRWYACSAFPKHFIIVWSTWEFVCGRRIFIPFIFIERTWISLIWSCSSWLAHLSSALLSSISRMWFAFIVSILALKIAMFACKTVTLNVAKIFLLY